MRSITLENNGDLVFALVCSIVAAAIAGAIGIIASMFLGVFLGRIGLLSGEGVAWSGISLGIPMGLVCAAFGFRYCFRKIRAYGNLNDEQGR